MHIRNLYTRISFAKQVEQFPVEQCRFNEKTRHNELLITVFGQQLWIDAQSVTLYKAHGSVFCWKDLQEGKYVELNEKNKVCPVCGWWKCHACDSCRCNKL